MRIIGFTLAFILYANALFAQEPPVKAMISAFSDYAANHPVEKILI